MLAALLRNLRRAGLAHEAARALQQRIDIERARGGADSLRRVAELNLELSLLKLDDLHDPAAARKEVEAALEAAPENPAALAALAQLHLKQNDFAAYAATRVREARALRARADGQTSPESPAPPASIDALLDAGRVYREQVQAPDKARACFEEAPTAARTGASSLTLVLRATGAGARLFAAFDDRCGSDGSSSATTGPIASGAPEACCVRVDFQ